MYKFENFVFLQKIKLILENVEDHVPKDGRWDKPLSSSETTPTDPFSFDIATYRFNVEGDDLGNNKNPSYAVTFHGHPTKTVYIAFSRDKSYSESGKNVGISVFQGVLKAISEYINTSSPVKITWSPVEKITQNSKTKEIINPDARAKIYEGWSVRHLFPNKYVSVVPNTWIRRDSYDELYVKKGGYPQIPDREMSLKDKNKTLKEIRDFYRRFPKNYANDFSQTTQDLGDESDQLSQTTQGRRDSFGDFDMSDYMADEPPLSNREPQGVVDNSPAGRQMQLFQRLMQVERYLSSPSHNPQNFRVDDIVEFERNQCKIKEFKLHGENLKALVVFKLNKQDSNFNGMTEYVDIHLLQRASQNSFKNYLQKKTGMR